MTKRTLLPRPLADGQALHASLSRRGLLRAGGLGLTGAGAALLFGCGGDDTVATDGELETTRIRIPATGSICVSPMLLARKFLPAEGFTDIVPWTAQADYFTDVAEGRTDFGVFYGFGVLQQIDNGLPLTILTGVHAGCFEVFARRGIDAIADLKGQKIGYPKNFGSDFIASVLRYVGFSAGQDSLLGYPGDDLTSAFSKGEVDAVVAVPPWGERLRAANAGHVILNSVEDRPWSQYYCCVIYANSAFVKNNPVATKRALRAIFKGADFISQDPQGAARYLVDQGYTADFAETGATFKHLNYRLWRDWHPEDTVRFMALRGKDNGTLKLTPDQIINRGTDWRFLNELKREMPALAFAPGSRSGFALNCEVGPLEPPLAAANAQPAVRS